MAYHGGSGVGVLGLWAVLIYIWQVRPQVRRDPNISGPDI